MIQLLVLILAVLYSCFLHLSLTPRLLGFNNNIELMRCLNIIINMHTSHCRDDIKYNKVSDLLYFRVHILMSWHRCFILCFDFPIQISLFSLCFNVSMTDNNNNIQTQELKLAYIMIWLFLLSKLKKVSKYIKWVLILLFGI